MKGICENCHEDFTYTCSYSGKKYKRRFCGKVCETSWKQEEFMTRSIADLDAGNLNDVNARRLFRRISDKICSICLNSEWNGKDIPLVVDHIDGNHTNNKRDNLRLICCNCDAQLPTYKSRNNGRGRTNRKA